MQHPLLHFVHVSDTHIHYDPVYGLDNVGKSALKGARALVDRLNSLPFTPDFILHTGDVAADALPGIDDTVRSVFGELNHPIRFLAGNHDPKHFPREREFEVNDVQFVCVDSNGPAEPPRGFVTEPELTRLRRVCASDDDRPLVIATHHNVLPVGSPWYDEFMRMTNGEDFHRALLPARGRIRGVFFGHVHQDIETVRDGILYSAVSSSWCQFHAWPGQPLTVHDRGAQPGFNVVTISKDQTTIRRHRFSV
jgi:3',5'-cyclic-AMP phosphodiesterase